MCSIRKITNIRENIVQAYRPHHLDYCNVLLQGVSDSLVRKVRSVQNAAACLIIAKL